MINQIFSCIIYQSMISDHDFPENLLLSKLKAFMLTDFMQNLSRERPREIFEGQLREEKEWRRGGGLDEHRQRGLGFTGLF